MASSKDPMRQSADRSRQATLAASLLTPFMRHAARERWLEEVLVDLCARYGVSRAAFDDLTATLPADAAIALVEEICARSRDDHLGLHLARDADASWMSLPGVLCMSLGSVREAIEIGAHYGQRLDPGSAGAAFFRDDEGLFHMTYVPGPQEPVWPRHFIEAAVAACLVLLRRFTGITINAARVSFMHEAPVGLEEYVDLFRTADIRFGMPFIGLVLPVSVLDLPHQSADPLLAAYLRRQAEALIDAMDGGDDIESAVRRILRDTLRLGGEVSLRGVAQNLKMTSRTLQRRLSRTGAGFSTLLEHVRCEMALEMLQRSRANDDEIAEHVGFSDARSLRRALKRRTGQTPSKLRRNA